MAVYLATAMLWYYFRNRTRENAHSVTTEQNVGGGSYEDQIICEQLGICECEWRDTPPTSCQLTTHNHKPQLANLPTPNSQ